MALTRKSRKRKHIEDSNGEASRSSNVLKSPYFSPSCADDTEPAKHGDTRRLQASFYDRPCEALAKALLGQRLVHMLRGEKRIVGDIIETEAYLGEDDSASHTYKGRRTDRNEAMYMCPGTCYVYLIYGMYDCLNISSRGDGQAVLIRALEPKEGIPTMQTFRSRRRKNPTKELKTKDLCNGPGKLTEALCIKTKEINQVNLVTDLSLWVERGGEIDEGDIVSCPRVRIDYATPEWVKKPMRFYIRGNNCVTKRDKEAEVS